MFRAFLKIQFIFSVVPAFAQVDSNTVTVIASRYVNLQPDQASIVVVVTAPITATLDDVLGTLPGTGATATNLTTVFDASEVSAPLVNWAFTLIVPLAKLRDTNTALLRLQANLNPRGSSFTIAFGGANVGTSDRAVHAQSCAATDLLADARVQAQQIAAATQRVLGRLLAMAGSTADECSIAVKFSVVGF